MTTTAKFPTTALTLAQAFGEMPNAPELVLSGIHNASTTSIVVTTAIPAGWPQVSWITIDSEILRVTSWAVSTFTVAARDGSAANSQTTTAASHADASKVGMYLTALQWNQIVAEVIAIETQLGAAFAEYAGRTDRWSYYWNPAMSGASTEYTVTGTGGQAVTAGKLENQLTTGATSGGTAGIRTLFGTGGTGKGGSGKCRRLEIVCAITNNTNNQTWAFLTDETVATAPSLTARHLGIRSANAVVVFSTADGATEQTTDISASFPADDTEHRAVITFDGVTAKCYVDGVLAATHATNVPSTQVINPVMRWFILNSAAANKTLRASSFGAVMAA